MEITDFAKGVLWGIRPSVLEEMLGRIPDLEKAAQMAVRFSEDPQERDELRIIDGVGIIPITGPITKRSSFFSFLFGGCSINRLTEAMMEALADPAVKAILLDVDSPGGTVAGTEAFGDLVYEARSEKPIVAFANGMMASAAYWVGSGANQVVAERTADVGSIGVLMVHHDWSKEDEMMGLKRTILSAGKYKALGNDAEPLSDLARDTFQAELDYIYTLFVDTVARNRGTDADTVLKEMADGRIFIGEQAVEAGLADSVGSFDSAQELAASLARANRRTPVFNFNSQAQAAKEESTMKTTMTIPENVAQLEEALPDMVAAIRQQGADSVNLEDARTEGSTGEKDRIVGIAVIQFGEDAGEKFKAVIESGISADQFKAVKAATPEPPTPDTSAADEMLEQIHDAGAANPGADAGASAGGGAKGFMVQVEEYVTVHKCTKTVAIEAVMKADPAAHKAYLESVN